MLSEQLFLALFWGGLQLPHTSHAKKKFASMTTLLPKVNLQLARVFKSPQQFFEESSDFATSKGLLLPTQWDMYGDYSSNPETSWLRRFEADVAARIGKEDGIFLLSGVMSQNIIAKIHEKSRSSSNKFVCHYSSHLLLHEHDGFSELLKVEPLIVPRRESLYQNYMSYDDVSPLLDSEPKPFMLIIECPHREIGGKVTPFVELEKMSEHCRRRGIAFHCDGARLWEAEAAFAEEGKTLNEVTNLFDSVYVSFYKGLGGVTGAMLLGSTTDIAEARIWSRRFGGNVIRYLPYGLSCWKGFEENPPIQFTERRDKLRAVVAALTAESKTHFNSLLEFDPPVPCVSMIHVYIHASPEMVIAAKVHAEEETGINCFFGLRTPPAASGAGLSCFELNMVRERGHQRTLSRYTNQILSHIDFLPMLSQGPNNILIDESEWVKGWRSLLSKLTTLLSEKA